MIAALEAMAAAVLAGAFALGLLASGAAVARRLLPDAGPVARIGASVVGACWIALAQFYLLSAFGWFRPFPAALLVAVTWLGLRRGAGRASLVADLATTWRSAARDAPTVLWLACAALLVPLAVALVRGFVVPPLGWDALVYHLPKAAGWVQSGRWLVDVGPGSWGYYAWYPDGAEVLYAWGMLPLSDDRLIGGLGVSFWLLAAFAVLLCTRELGSSRAAAIAGGTLFALMPASALSSNVGYVDSALAAFHGLGLGFLLRFLRAPRRCELVVAGAALGLAASIKLTGLGLAAVAGVFIVFRLSRAGTKSVAAGALSFAAPLALGLAPYLRNAVLAGSPLYPMPLELPGWGALAFDPALVEELGRGPDPISTLEQWPRLLSALFIDPVFFRELATQHLNFGLPMALVFPLAVLGALRLRDARVGLIVAGAALVVAGFLSPGFADQRGAGLSNAGRLLLPVAAAAIVLAASLSRPARRAASWVAPLLLAIACLELPGALPAGIGHSDARAMVSFVSLPSLLLAVALAVAALALRSTRRVRLAVGFAAAGCAVWSFAVRLPEIRTAARYAIYEEAFAEIPLYQMHPIEPDLGSALSLWRQLDDGRAKTIALTGGDTQWFGRTWYRFPLYGARLENRVVHVAAEHGGQRAWLEGLARVEADWLVCLGPRPDELGWARARPDLFREVAVTRAGDVLLQVDRTALARE